MEVNGEQATYPNGHPQDDGGRAAGARCGQAAETRIRLRLRRRQEPAEVGADGAGTDGSGSTAAALEAAAAYRRGRGGGGSESAATLVAAAARQHTHRPQQVPRGGISGSSNRGGGEGAGGSDRAATLETRGGGGAPAHPLHAAGAARLRGRCGELGLHGEMGICAACQNSAAPSHMTPAPCPRQARAPPPPRERRIAPQHAAHTPAHRPPRALSSALSPMLATPMPSPANSQHTLRTSNQHLPNIPSPGIA